MFPVHKGHDLDCYTPLSQQELTSTYTFDKKSWPWYLILKPYRKDPLGFPGFGMQSSDKVSMFQTWQLGVKINSLDQGANEGKRLLFLP